jgi:hypothetical protein
VIQDVINNLIHNADAITTPQEGRAVVEIIESIHNFGK